MPWFVHRGGEAAPFSGIIPGSFGRAPTSTVEAWRRPGPEKDIRETLKDARAPVSKNARSGCDGADVACCHEDCSAPAPEFSSKPKSKCIFKDDSEINAVEQEAEV